MYCPRRGAGAPCRAQERKATYIIQFTFIKIPFTRKFQILKILARDFNLITHCRLILNIH